MLGINALSGKLGASVPKVSASATMTVQSEKGWDAFCSDRLPSSALEYSKLLSVQDDETAPYKSRYRAAEQQAELASELATITANNARLQVRAVDSHITASTLKGRICIRRGVALSETDLATDARDSLQEGLAALALETPCQDVQSKLTALNTLGALQSGVGQSEAALAALQEAERLFTGVRNGDCSVAGSDALLRLERNTDTDATTQVEQAYAHTVFYLAQVHQNLGHTEEAKAYCGATLQQQVAAWGASSSQLQSAVA